MPEIITCPQCQRRLLLPENLHSQPIQCPSCQASFEADIPTVLPADVVATGPTPTALPPAVSTSPAETTEPFRFNVPAAPAKRRRQLSLPRLVAVVVLVLIGWSLAKNIEWPQPRPAPVAEDPALRQAEVRRAFQDGPPLAENELAASLLPLFEDFGKALRERDPGAIAAHWDLPRTIDELVAQGLPGRGRRDDSQLGKVLGQALAKQAVLLQWQTSEIRHVKRLAGDEAVVTVRHRGADGVALKMRWWVRWHGDAWKIYDLEDLDTSIRFSALAGTVAGRNPAEIVALTHGVHLVRDALIEVAINHDPDAADKLLAQVKVERFPAPIEAVRLMTRAAIHCQRGEAEDALKAVEQAQTLRPDMPALDLLKGIVYNQLQQWNKALQHLQLYRDLLGDDALVCEQLGIALSNLNRFEEARRHYRKALDEDPQNIDIFVSLIRALEPGNARDDLGPRFAKLDQPKLHFPTLVEECRQGRDSESLTAICLAMQNRDPQYAPADFNLAQVQVWQGHIDQAVPHLRSAIAKDPPSRKAFLQELLKDVAAAGQGLSVYQALADQPETFSLLAVELVQRMRHDDLRRLVAAHRPKHPDEPLLPFCQGELDTWNGRYQRADQAFQAGMAKPPDAATLERFRSARVTARYHTGQALAAYAEIGPAEDTFQQLAELAFKDQQHELLEKLLAAHGQKYADSASLVRYRCTLKLAQKQGAEAADIFKAALAKPLDDDERGLLIEDFLQAAIDFDQPLIGYRAAPEASGAFNILAWGLIHRHQGETLAQLIAIHRQSHAGDAWIPYFEGQWLKQQQDWVKAAEKFRQAMTADDSNHQFWSEWAQAMSRTGQSLQAYRDAPEQRRVDVFEQLVTPLVRAKRTDELQALIAEVRPQLANTPGMLMAEAQLRILQNQPVEACASFQQAIAKEDEPYRRQARVRRFVIEMARAGHGLAAYRAAPDRVLAFQTLAPYWLQQKEPANLSALLEEHAQHHPHEAQLRCYQGERDLLLGQFAAAEKLFAAELKRAAPAQQYQLRHGLYRARIKLGQIVETYREFGFESLQPLANICLNDRNVAELEKLLAAQRQVEPDDPAFPAWQLELAYLKQDYAGVLKQIHEHRDVLVLPQHRWKMDDCLVRSLVKLQRYPEAVQEAEKIGREGQRLLLVLAHAASGDPKQTISALRKMGTQTWQLRACYTDPDLGPILKSDRFQAFRQQFPEPAEFDYEDDLDLPDQ